MKEFFKYTLASIIGFFISFVLVFGLMFIIIFSMMMASLSKPDVTVDENSVLKIQLNQTIEERTSDSPLDHFDPFTFQIKKNLGLKQIIDDIERAKTDDNIEGIFLDLSVIPARFATIEEIRDALIEFKESDKFIYAYADRFLQFPYYLASVSDSIFMHPAQAEFAFRGMHYESAFLRGTFDKLDIEPMVFRAGEYKSAGETYDRYGMSDENREQLEAMLTSVYDHFLTGINKHRGINIDSMKHWANNMDVVFPEEAKEKGFIDELWYRDELDAFLKKRLDVDEDEDVNMISLSRYSQVPGRSERQEKGRGSDKRVAVIYGLGTIVDGEGNADQLSAKRFSSAIRDARESEDVKAIVLRINTPGGSALASDVIWREIRLAADEKPVVASMGGMAASGGYYIAAGADKIYARSTTLTGSIGVIAMLPYMEHFWENKLGIRFDRVKTGDYADFGNPNRRMEQKEADMINRIVQRYYDGFIDRVSEGRGMPPHIVDSLGGGRIYSGIDAVKNGLVDEIGGFYEAVEGAAELAGIDEYRIRVLPRMKNPFERLFEDFAATRSDMVMKQELGEYYNTYRHIRFIHDNPAPMAIMPWHLELKE